MSQIHHQTYEKMKEHFPSMEYCLDLPRLSDILMDNLPKLLIMDDLSSKILRTPFMEDLFIQHSHHQNCSVIFTTQNYFESSKNKTIIRQCNYKVIFQSPSDMVLLRHISCQIKPDDANFLSRIFEKLENLFPDDSYRYVLIDGEPKSPMKNMRVRTHIFRNSDGVINPLCFF